MTKQYVVFRLNGEVVPVKAVQYEPVDPDDLTPVSYRLNGHSFTVSHDRVLDAKHHWESAALWVRPGQWLAVSESGEVWVLDDEPVWRDGNGFTGPWVEVEQ